ncbi:hypothetical protein Tco_1360974 [Tanacetum coccineum]
MSPTTLMVNQALLISALIQSSERRSFPGLCHNFKNHCHSKMNTDKPSSITIDRDRCPYDPYPELIGRSQFHEPSLIASKQGRYALKKDTSELVHGNDYCKLRYHLLLESESKVLVSSFGF